MNKSRPTRSSRDKAANVAPKYKGGPKKPVDASQATTESPKQDEYEVEKIMAVRVKKEYLVKWKGYPEEESTWEPVENLNCPSLLKSIEKKRR